VRTIYEVPAKRTTGGSEKCSGRLAPITSIATDQTAHPHPPENAQNESPRFIAIRERLASIGLAPAEVTTIVDGPLYSYVYRSWEAAWPRPSDAHRAVLAQQAGARAAFHQQLAEAPLDLVDIIVCERMADDEAFSALIPGLKRW
jgi:hypothetical protein